MATPAQIAANRRNAQKSSGPRTAAGKAASRMNALKSGIHAEELVIRGEYPDELERLTTEYYGEFHPVTPRERDLVDAIVRNEWIIRRMGLVEAQLWGHQFQHNDSVRPPDRLALLKRKWPLGQAFVAVSGQFERLQRRISALERSTRRALQELAELRAQRDPALDEQPVDEQPTDEPPDSAAADAQDFLVNDPQAEPSTTSEGAAQPPESEPSSAPIGFVPPDSLDPATPPSLLTGASPLLAPGPVLAEPAAASA